MFSFTYFLQKKLLSSPKYPFFPTFQRGKNLKICFFKILGKNCFQEEWFFRKINTLVANTWLWVWRWKADLPWPRHSFHKLTDLANLLSFIFLRCKLINAVELELKRSSNSANLKDNFVNWSYHPYRVT